MLCVLGFRRIRLALGKSDNIRSSPRHFACLLVVLLSFFFLERALRSDKSSSGGSGGVSFRDPQIGRRLDDDGTPEERFEWDDFLLSAKGTIMCPRA